MTQATVCHYCVLLYCSHLILFKTTNEETVFVISGPAKVTVITLQASVRQKSSTFSSGFIKALQMSQKTRLRGLDVLVQMLLFLPPLKNILILN